MSRMALLGSSPAAINRQLAFETPQARRQPVPPEDEDDGGPQPVPPEDEDDAGPQPVLPGDEDEDAPQ